MFSTDYLISTKFKSSLKRQGLKFRHVGVSLYIFVCVSTGKEEVKTTEFSKSKTEDKDFDKAGFDKVLRIRQEEFEFFEEARLKGQTRGK